MKRYLLDTPILAAYLIGREPARDLIVPWLMRHEAVTSTVVYGEVFEYIRGFRNFDQRLRYLQTLIQVCNIAPISREIMETYADLRRSMRRPHGDGLIGDIDTMIAATCLRHGLTVVNTDAHFQRVPQMSAVITDLSESSSQQ